MGKIFYSLLFIVLCLIFSSSLKLFTKNKIKTAQSCPCDFSIGTRCFQKVVPPLSASVGDSFLVRSEYALTPQGKQVYQQLAAQGQSEFGLGISVVPDNWSSNQVTPAALNPAANKIMRVTAVDNSSGHPIRVTLVWDNNGSAAYWDGMHYNGTPYNTIEFGTDSNNAAYFNAQIWFPASNMQYYGGKISVRTLYAGYIGYVADSSITDDDVYKFTLFKQLK